MVVIPECRPLKRTGMYFAPATQGGNATGSNVATSARNGLLKVEYYGSGNNNQFVSDSSKNILTGNFDCNLRVLATC